MIQVGLISDTHSLLRPEAVEALRGSDYIIHAGDIGSPDVLNQPGQLALVTAIRGNIDKAEWASEYPDEEVLEVDGVFFYVIHNLHDIDLDPVAAEFNVVVSGHSHKPKIEETNGVLYVNPGSAGPRRFSLPISVAKLKITKDGINANVIVLVA